MNKLRITIADDHQIVRLGLRCLFAEEPDISVVAESSSTMEAVEAIQREQPHVAVLDLNMPDRFALDLLPAIRASSPQTHVLILTMHTDEETVRNALAAGAHGFLTKESSPREIIGGIRTVAAGRVVVSVPVLGSGTPRPRTLPPQRPLSAREHQVLQLFARGMTHREVAEELSVRLKTIETYRSRLGDKFGARTRAELIQQARSMGLVEPAPRPASNQ
jgi:DNA-binding NarL/FixJ family response regulator